MKKISVGEIIYRINEHPLLQNVRKSDIVNHIKTVIELVGAPGLKEEKKVTLFVKEFRSILPDDFIDRKSVRLKISTGWRIVLGHNTDEFAKFDRDIYIREEEDHHETLFTHQITNGYIYTDFKEGEIEIVYTAYSVDDNGWPMIPKNESLIKAIEEYIKSRHFSILADMNSKYVGAYQKAEQQYNWYVAQATSSFINLDPVEAEAFVNRFIRMIPVEDDFYTNDKFNSQPERVNRKLW